MLTAFMRILTYKRTHVGDPDRRGRFGIFDCMGSVRDYQFDAVIGVGGVSTSPRREGIAGKLTWVGVAPIKRAQAGKRASQVTFRSFLLLDEDGPLLRTLAPYLARRLFEGGARALLTGYSSREHADAVAIVHWALSKAARRSRTSLQSLTSRRRCRAVVTRAQRKCHSSSGS